ncbi:choice-of-anchor L domain-containing protein [uncultured Sulfitobacter sp.]|uniref:choice-of-anchor L domain-containing protein n=1 Tax=uncultured Sulfitobacter sp. TaxID=191468 RepID=UPI00260E9F2E|nr:choice-of-anchor L domain-containing protein [uncultured Sulfitobacter sp.]
MPIATELAINTTADATTLAQTIFGNGVTIGTATLTGAAGASGTYSGADATLGTIAPGDAGIILSTGQAADFTNSSGTTDTNTSESGASTNNNQLGDTQLDAVTGQSTQDAVILEATFTPTGDYITMLFTFSSEEYLEYVNGGVNDAFGVWVNTVYVPFNPVPGGVVSIDTVNSTVASNLYIDNPTASDTYNTEMDGTTQVLSINAPVNSGALNTIRIALADGGDGVYDTNVLIAANSVQTIAVAFDDEITVEANTATTVDVLDNDIDTTGNGLTITEINGVPVIVGQTVTLPTGEQVTLNADNTITILSDNDLGSEPFTYTVVDSAGNTDVGFVTVTTEADVPLNYIVEGTSGNDTINAGYTLDPQGDMIDAGDALDGSNDDSIEAGAGNDIIDAGAGADTIVAGTGNDEVFAGAGNDSVIAGEGNDTVFGQGGNDTILGGAGADALDGDDGDDSIDGGTGDDTLIGDLGNDTLLGGAGNDEIYGSTGSNFIDGGSNNDLIFGGNQADTIFGGSETDTIAGGGGNDIIDGGTEADQINGDDGNDTLLGGTGDDTISGGQNDDSIDGGDGADSVSGDDGNDTVSGGAGNDSVFGGAGDDSLSGGTGDDSVEAWIGNDTLDGGEGNDYLDGSDGNDSLLGGDGHDTLLGGNNGGEDTLIGGAGDDSLSAGDGDDTLNGGTGDDTLLGASGDDVNILENGFGNDIIAGGETGETKGDALDLSAVTDDLTVDLTALNPEAGTVSDGTDTATFTEIENIVLGAGTDTLILGDGSGADSIEGFAPPTVDGAGNWTGVDQLDVTGMSDANGALVNTNDITVSDTNGDGTGDAILIFPGNESLTLIGVPAAIFNDPEALEAIGIPMPNYIVEGTGGNDNIDASYTGDPEGDMVDTNDNATGTNADSIEAGNGNDTVTAGAGDDTVMGGTGDDLISGDAGNDLLDGEIGDDTIAGGTGADTIDGAEGDDVIVLEDGFGNDSIDGGQTTEATGDTLDLSATTTGVTVNLTDADPEDGTVSDGTDTATFIDIENIILGGGRDTVVLADGSGADTIQAFDLTDSGDGTTNDQLDVSGLTSDGGTTPVNTNDVVVSDTNGDGTGDAILTFTGGESITLVGVLSSEVDSVAGLVSIGIPIGPNYIVEGTSGDDLINAGYTDDPEGDMIDAGDALDGSDDDSVEAGAGNDTISSGSGDDTVMGGDGNDYITAGSGNDVVFGEAGNDVIFGFGGDDTLLGGDGADVINGMAGADLIDGGADNDTFRIEDAFGADTIIGGETTTTGTDFDTLAVNTAAIVDPITVVYSGNEAGTFSDGTDTLGFSEIERITLSDGADTVDGSATTSGINIATRDGNDSVIGGTGADTVEGGQGADTITGGLGADDIDGGTGDDVLQAAQGDTLEGGDGDDLFTLFDLGEAGSDAIFINGGEGAEINGDTLDLNGIADRTTINITNPIDVGGGISGTVQLLDGTVVNFNNIENIICFVPGTLVATHSGLRKIEDLKVGDPVITQDNGLQKIGWIGKTTVCGDDKFAPVNFAKSVFPGALDDLTVSPQHRMLIKGYRAELLFGQSEVLVPALHLIDGKDVVRKPQESVTYIHIMFEQHEIIFANGIPAESFHPAAFGVDRLADDARSELFELFPELRSDLSIYGPTARMALKAKEAKVLSEFSL